MADNDYLFNRRFFRTSNTPTKPEILYGSSNDRYFTIKLNHGGKFTPTPERCYVGRRTTYFEFLDINSFDVGLLKEMIQFLGMSIECYCYFWDTDFNLDLGIIKMMSDPELLILKRKLVEHDMKVIPQLFVQHGEQTLYMSYPRSILKASDNEIAKMLHDFLWMKPFATVHDVIDLFEMLHGVRMLESKMERCLVKAKRDLSFLYE